MSASSVGYRLAVRYRVVVAPPNHPAAASNDGPFPYDLPLSWPADCGFAQDANTATETYADGATVVGLFRSTLGESAEGDFVTESLMAAAADDCSSWHFKPVVEAESVVIGRAPATGAPPQLPSTRYHGLLRHGYASREQCSFHVAVDGLAYNRSAVQENVAVRLLGKNPIFVNGRALTRAAAANGRSPDVVLKPFAANTDTNGAPALASIAQVRAAECRRRPSVQELELINRNRWNRPAGVGAATGLAVLRLVMCGRVTFPEEFRAVLPVILVVAEVVTPLASLASPPTATILAATVDDGLADEGHDRRAMRLEISDDDETQDDDDAPPPSRRHGVVLQQRLSGPPSEIDSSFACRVLRDGVAAQPSFADEDDDEPPPSARQSRLQQQQQPAVLEPTLPVSGTLAVGGFAMRQSSESSSDGSVAAVKRRMSAATLAADGGASPPGDTAAPRATNRVDAWATAVMSGASPRAVLTKPPAAAASGATPKPRAARPTPPTVAVAAAVPKMPSSDDVPLFSTTADKTSHKAANSLVRVVTADDDDAVFVSPPPPAKRAPRAEAGASSDVVWAWKASRAAADTDVSAWKPYPASDSLAIEAATASGKPTVAIAGGTITVVLGASAGTAVQHPAADPHRTRPVKRFAATVFSGGAPSPSLTTASSVAVGSMAAAAPPPPVAVWEWKAMVDADDRNPAAWRRYSAADSAALEAAFQRGDQTMNLSADYAVVFNDRRAGTAQYRRDDPSRWRAVRRQGGPAAPRPSTTKGPRIIEDVASSSSGGDSEDGDGSSSSGDDSWNDDSSDGSSWPSSSSASDSKKRRGDAAARKKAPTKKHDKAGATGKRRNDSAKGATGAAAAAGLTRKDSRHAPGADRYVGAGSWLVDD